MRALFSVAMAGTMLVTVTPAAAQESEPSVANYLCQFAGKCGDAAAAAEPEMTKEAPLTKGFRLARATTPAKPAAAETAPTRSVASLRPGAGATRAPATNYRAPRAAPVAGTRADLRISFQLGSDQMTDVGVSKARIFAQAAALPELTGKRFLIEGHTDSLGNYASNVDLSRRRAQAVADYLVAQGVDRSRLEVKGTGPDAPLAGRTKTDPANRRVEAQLLP